MQAMIFAAGLGTRLKPFTDKHPKALFPIAGKPVIQRVIEHIKSFGIKNIVINVHHFPEQIIDFIEKKEYFECNIKFSDETEELLETGGGLLKARHFFNPDEPILAYNADIVSDIDLRKLEQSFHETNSLATLAVRQRATSRYFLFDENLQLAGWENKSSGEKKITRTVSTLNAYAFSGIQIINPDVFSLITEAGKFSLTQLYLRLSADYKICGHLHNEGYWFDIGKADNVAQVEEFLKN